MLIGTYIAVLIVGLIIGLTVRPLPTWLTLLFISLQLILLGLTVDGLIIRNYLLATSIMDIGFLSGRSVRHIHLANSKESSWYMVGGI
jgi:hypothetical protein